MLYILLTNGIFRRQDNTELYILSYTKITVQRWHLNLDRADAMGEYFFNTDRIQAKFFICI